MGESGNERWQEDVRALVDEIVVEQGTSIKAEEGLDAQLAAADAGDRADVAFALEQLFRIVDELAGTDAAGSAMAAATDLLLRSFTETADSTLLYRVATFLRSREARDMAAAILDHALGLGVQISPVDAGRLYNLLGELLRETDRLGDAETAYDLALRALEDDSDAHDAERSVILNNLGLVSSARHDRVEAKRYFLRSLEVADRIGLDPLSTAVTLDNLATTELGFASDAGPLRRSNGLINGVVAEHLDQAEQYFDRARGLFEGGLPGSAEDYVVCLLNLADLAWQRGDRDRRLGLSDRSIEIARSAPLSTGTTWSAVQLRGEVLLDRGDAQEAVDLMTSWFRRLLPTMEPQALISQGLAILLRAATSIGDQALADSVAGSIAGNDAQVMPRRLLGGSEAEQRKAFGEFNGRTGLILGHCLPAKPAGVAPEWLYELLLNTKGVLAEVQGSAWLRARVRDGAGAELLAQVRELRAEVARLDLEGSGGTSIRAARRRYEEAERRLSAVEVELQRELATFAGSLRRVSVGDVQASIPPDALLLDFVSVEARDGTEHDIAFMIRSEGPVTFRDTGPADETADNLEALTSAVALPPEDDGSRDQQAVAVIRDHAPTLFDATDKLPDRILVSATGTWGLAPLGLLPDESGRPLLERHVVTMVPSARWIVLHAVDPGGGESPGPSVVLGDPDFDVHLPEKLPFEMSASVSRLDEAGVEAREVGQALGVEAVVGARATRQRLLDVSRPRVLHLACHGVFLTSIASFAEQAEPRGTVMRLVAGTVVSEEMENLDSFVTPATAPPDDAAAVHRSRVEWLLTIGPAGQLSRSALLLAGFNAWLAGVETPDDVGIGLVSAGEFAMLDLEATELVVLSACETGVGAVDAADGSLMGLRTAALAAGAASCVSTLWNVDDEAATALVSAFYDGLKAGDDVGTALRAAQLALQDRYPDPYYWAGWVAEGTNRPISV